MVAQFGTGYRVDVGRFSKYSSPNFEVILECERASISNLRSASIKL
jgi:hypothetical protein